MKTIYYFLLVGIVCVIASCDLLKGGGDDIVISPTATYEVIPSTTITAGEAITITLTSKSGVKSATINGKVIDVNIPYTEVLKSDAVLLMVLQGETVSKEIKIAITVKPEARMLMISDRPWHISSIDQLYEVDNNWYTFFHLTQKEKESNYYFYKDLTLVELYKDGTQVASCLWKWIGLDSIQIGDQNYTYTMTDTNLDLYQVLGNKKIRDRYWR
jgi:hypothetical protein